MIRKVVAGVALAVFIAGPAVAWDGSNKETEEANTKKTAEESAVKGAEARLKEAWAIKKTSFKKETAVKHAILLETVECYRSLLDEFSECHPDGRDIPVHEDDKEGRGGVQQDIHT